MVQPVGHRTVNADGVGSNPTAPAKFSPLKMAVSVASVVFIPIELPYIFMPISYFRPKTEYRVREETVMARKAEAGLSMLVKIRE